MREGKKQIEGVIESEKGDSYNLARFLTAQEGNHQNYSSYQTALKELKNGKKETCWVWYVFPQIEGLGSSPMDETYSIKSLAEARAYLRHPILGGRLIECAQALLGVEFKPVRDIMGFPDDLKLKSSMTLFEIVSDSIEVFGQVIDKYYDGERDLNTINKLNR